MKDRYIKTKDQMIAARSRAVARLFAGRIFVQSGKIFIVNGNPDPDALFKCLCDIKEVPDNEKEPDPFQLGFSASDIRPVGNKELNDWNQALIKWQKITQKMAANKRQRSGNRKKLEKWKIEIKYLENRRELLFAIKSQKSSLINPITRWIPSDAENIQIDKVFSEIAAGKVLSPLWKWFAVITRWIGGENSLSRFIKALSEVCPTEHEHEVELCIELICKKFKQFQKELEFDSKQTVFHRVTYLLKNIPPEILNAIGISLPERLKAIKAYLLQQIPYIEKRYKEIIRIDLNNIAIAVIITALDDSNAQFPSRIFTLPVEDKSGFYKTLLDLSKNNLYKMILFTLDKLEVEEYSPSVLVNISNMLSAGADYEDINWIYDQYLYTSIDDFSNKRLSPRSARLVITVLEDFGEDICSEVDYIFDRLISSGSTWFIDAFSGWLLKIPKKYWNKSTARTAWNTMLSGLALSEFDIKNRSIIHLWANPTRKKRLLNIPGELSSETKKGLEVLVYYQKLLGRGEELPKSLTNLFLTNQKKHEELTNLKKLKDIGELSDAASYRLLKLENEFRKGNEKLTLKENKIKRKAQEISARLAIDALSEIVRRKNLWYFNQEFKTNPPNWINFHELADIIIWSRQLKGDHKEVFSEIINAWKDNGPGYKNHLLINKGWLERISKRIPKIKQWLHPEPMKYKFAKGFLTIELSNDPFRIFLMGSYFDTCLGLRYGSNRESVLANAYDANKGVLFAYNEQGTVLARKLLAITDNGRLVGYNTYINSDKEKERKIIKQKITYYCALLASETGLRLVNKSKKIKSLTGIYWYDDGSEPWNIKELGGSEVNKYQLDFLAEEQEKANRMGFLAIKHKSQLQDIFSRIKLHLLPDDKSIYKLCRDSPALIEEALVYVARENRDPLLLKELTDNCQTESGKIEVLIGNILFSDDVRIRKLDLDKSEIRYSRVDAVLCNSDTTTSLQITFYKSLQDYFHLNTEVLFPILWKFQKSVIPLIEFLIKESEWYVNFHDLLVIIHFLRMHLSVKLPDALINKIIVHLNVDYSENRAAIENNILAICQWLPLYNDFRNFLSKKLLYNEFYKEFPIGSPGNERGLLQVRTHLAIIIWLMRNRCAFSIKFLKELSDFEPAALLALSIVTTPYRFQDHITQNALQNIKSPAAVMALLNVHGRLKTTEILKNSGLFKDLVFKNYFKIITSLYEAYQNLSWEAVSNQIQKIDLKDRIECLPLIIYQVHKALYSSIDGGFGNINSKEEIKGIINSEIDTAGLLISLADRLRTCENTKVQFRIRRFLHLLMNELNSSSKERLWLNIISNDRLYVDLNEEFVKKTLYFGWKTWDIVDPFDLFFDSNGKPRSTADLLWKGKPKFYPTNFPDNLEQAHVFAAFLKSKKIKPSFETEIHKRIYEIV
jgi:hypothetical protein